MIKDILHLRAPGGWINDPNGFIYYKGQYHLFYQHFPYAPRWGTMRWGHAVSDDLIHWKHLGIALFPTKEYDQNGVFSGNALEKDGKLYLYYTAVRYLGFADGDIHLPKDDSYDSSQALVISDDGVHFDNWKSKMQVVPVLRDPAQGDSKNSKDPKVWYEGGQYWMLLGNSSKDGRGMLVLLASPDAVHWTFASNVADERFGRIVECPDLFHLGDTAVIQYCAMYAGEDPENEGSQNDASDSAGMNGTAQTAVSRPAQEIDGADSPEDSGYPHRTYWCLADFDPETGTLAPRGARHLTDYGDDLYAPETTLDKAGRRVMIAWLRMPEPVSSDERGAWNGMMCMPRVVEMRGGHLYCRVHPVIDDFLSQEVRTNFRFLPDMYRVQAELRDGESLDLGGYVIAFKGGRVVTDRTRVVPGHAQVKRVCRTPILEAEEAAGTGPASEGGAVPCGAALASDGGEVPRGQASSCRLDIFVDRNVVEVFVNEGQYVISNVVYSMGRTVSGRIGRLFVPVE
ncbi:MAG: glycoside hydrolase family 32 protein [Lachnospiraceae bacterium]|nr:glycoside hydrolase family 32 protein [Lachnospiraceae bacterium]MCH4063744.1 glycoside hydrolase family 32 protein [Lachnospiraceae bacterium]MCH4103533.1 glycoside hydrolase family 32 protein [Lachnospiraceae bacterium]MCI1309886.1 glycoside hydrolase family 32 protein [Lachnospiraceae bacterium]MCI1334337.1 glycoside hydrolase family 32 protein [Lachnospiraceae bacterium]